MNSARLVFDPPPSSGQPVLQATGPWALFRLFAQGTLQQSDAADRYTLNFTLGDRHASFETPRRLGAEPVRPRRAARTSSARRCDRRLLRQAAGARRFRPRRPAARLHRSLGWLAAIGDGRQPGVDGRGLAAGLPRGAGLALHPAARHVRRTGGARPDAAQRGSGRPLLSADLRRTQPARRRQASARGLARSLRSGWTRRAGTGYAAGGDCRHAWLDRAAGCDGDLADGDVVERGLRAREAGLPDAALSARCGDLCGDAGRGRIRTRRDTTHPGRGHGSRRHDGAALSLLGGDASRRQADAQRGRLCRPARSRHLGGGRRRGRPCGGRGRLRHDRRGAAGDPDRSFGRRSCWRRCAWRSSRRTPRCARRRRGAARTCWWHRPSW